MEYTGIVAAMTAMGANDKREVKTAGKAERAAKHRKRFGFIEGEA
jgi:hypothetical protein